AALGRPGQSGAVPGAAPAQHRLPGDRRAGPPPRLRALAAALQGAGRGRLRRRGTGAGAEADDLHERLGRVRAAGRGLPQAVARRRVGVPRRAGPRARPGAGEARWRRGRAQRPARHPARARHARLLAGAPRHRPPRPQGPRHGPRAGQLRQGGWALAGPAARRRGGRGTAARRAQGGGVHDARRLADAGGGRPM
ncbi:MAG: Peptidyl-tRNA hydrolase, partial [uncultured Acetobacteraceae bacterium]